MNSMSIPQRMQSNLSLPSTSARNLTAITPNYGLGSELNRETNSSYIYSMNTVVTTQNPGTSSMHLNSNVSSAQRIQNPISSDPTKGVAAMSNSDSISSNTSDTQNSNQNQLVRYSEMLLKNAPFFLDLPIFIITVEEIYKVLEDSSISEADKSSSPILTSPGPSGMLDLYQLYCQHVAGDPHIVRTIESIINSLIRSQNPAALSIQDYLLTAKKKASSFGQKKGMKIKQFYDLYSLPFALDQPFICGESNIRHQLCTIWYKKFGIGPLRRKRMCQLYRQYCLHIENHIKFFNGIFGLTVVSPHGPFKITHLEHMVVMVKSMPFKKNFDGQIDKDQNNENDSVNDNLSQPKPQPDFDIYCENDMAMVHYIRQDFGVDHQLFQSLPSTLRYIVGNNPVTISVPKLSRQTPLSGDFLSSNIEFGQLCCSSPASYKDTKRIQFKFPSDLTIPEYVQVFSWIFLATEVPGVFVIRNEQWGEYLMVEDSASNADPHQSQAPDNYEFCQLSTSPDHKDESHRTKFTLVIQGQEVHIVSCFANAPIVVDGRVKRALVPKKTKDSDSDFNFGLGTVFFIKLA